MLKARLWRDDRSYSQTSFQRRQITARSRKPAGEDWLWKMLQRKPVKLVAIALAGRMARTVWALIKTGESYEAKAA